MKLIILVLIPLILSIVISPSIPFIDAVEYSQICIDKVWIEKTTDKIACVTSSTANKLVERGWGTLLAEDVFEEKPEIFESGIKQEEIDYEKELLLLAESDGGVGPITVSSVIGTLTKDYPEFYVPGTEDLDENEMRAFDVKIDIVAGNGETIQSWIIKFIILVLQLQTQHIRSLPVL